MSELFTLPKAVRVSAAGLPYAGAKANFYLTGTTTPTDTYEDSALSTAHDNPVVAGSDGQFAPIYLDPDTTYKVVITDADDNVLDTVDPIPSGAAATASAVTDSGGYFTATTVEGVLQEIGANYAVLADDEDIAGDWTVSGSVNFQDNILQRPLIQDYALRTVVVTSSSNAVTLDLSQGNSFTHTLTESTTITPSNPPASDEHGEFVIKIRQDGGGGAYTVTWPASFVWPGGSAPTMSTANDAEDIVIARTWDGGTTWYATTAQAFA